MNADKILKTLEFPKDYINQYDQGIEIRIPVFIEDRILRDKFYPATNCYIRDGKLVIQ